MTATIAMTEEKQEPRLYSRGYADRTPVDEIAPGQLKAHAWLIRWGRWQSESKGRAGLASVEGLYNKVGSPPSTAPMASDPVLMAIERAVIKMPEQHRRTLGLLYVRRFTPYTVCRDLGLRYECWPAWAFACRAMLQRLVSEDGYGL